MNDPIALYIHVPFCVKKCRYCDFYSTTGRTALIDRFIKACAIELSLRQDCFRDKVLTSIFIGGGTPSILSPMQWNALSSAVHSSLHIDESVEWTIECNPDSYSPEKARVWLAAGINRLSLGVQSLQHRLLSILGRPHTPDQALEVLQSKEAAEFRSCNVDVMYGLPGQKLEDLSSTLTSLLCFGHVKHLSAYELTVAENTRFGKHRQMLPLPSDDCVDESANLVIERTKAVGMRQYEISNFALPGYESVHNRMYWEYYPYIGIGPGAHSFFNGSRWANFDDLQRYCDLLKSNSLPTLFREQLSNEDKINELLFLGLRTKKGIDDRRFEEISGEPFYHDKRKPVIDRLVAQKMLIRTDAYWRLSQEAFLKADGIARMLA